MKLIRLALCHCSGKRPDGYPLAVSGGDKRTGRAYLESSMQIGCVLEDGSLQMI